MSARMTRRSRGSRAVTCCCCGCCHAWLWARHGSPSCTKNTGRNTASIPHSGGPHTRNGAQPEPGAGSVTRHTSAHVASHHHTPSRTSPQLIRIDISICLTTRMKTAGRARWHHIYVRYITGDTSHLARHAPHITRDDTTHTRITVLHTGYRNTRHAERHGYVTRTEHTLRSATPPGPAAGSDTPT